MKKPPVFISIVRKGATVGHIRADQIEGIYDKPPHASFPDEAITCVRTFSGFNAFTDDTLDQVFAKMADALNIEGADHA